MYTQWSSTLIETDNSANQEGTVSETERYVQQILTELEALPGEVQAAVCARLLTGLASKLTPAVATKAISAARTEGQPAKTKATSAKSRATTRTAAVATDVPRPDSQLRLLADPTDPVEAWDRFGGSAAQFFEVLREEPAGVLENMLSHRRMPPGPKPRGKSREKLAEAIAVRLEQQFKGQ